MDALTPDSARPVAFFNTRYPRVGHNIVPRVLSACLASEQLDPDLPQLDTVLPPGFRTLADLDARIWEYVGERGAKALAQEASLRLTRHLACLPTRLRPVTLGDVGSLSGRRLQLSVRTSNRLQEAGYLSSASTLLGCTLLTLSQLSGFGSTCMLDLLTSLESDGSQDDAPRRVAQRLTRELPSWSTRARSVEEILAFEDEIDTATLPADEEARRLLTFSETNERNRAVFVARHGWAGEPASTLEQVGRLHGLTRERVRQICARIEHRIGELAEVVGTPSLDRAITAMNASGFANVAAVEESLRSGGLLSEDGRVECLLDAADVVGRSHSIFLTDSDEEQYVGDSQVESLVALIRSRARRAAARAGAVNIATLADSFSAEGVQCEEDQIRAVVSAMSDSTVLDSEGDWYWLTPQSERRIRFLNQVRKVLSVADRVPLSELRTAVRRHRRMGGAAPPIDVLRNICRCVSWLRLEDNETTVCSVPPMRPEDGLRGAELQFARILGEYGPAMKVQDLWVLASRAGIGHVNFWVHLRNSPVIVRHAPCIYGLRGHEVSALELLSMTEETGARARHLLRDHEELPDGRFFALFELSRTVINRGSVRIPDHEAARLQGRYGVLADGDASASEVTLEGTNLGGLYRPLRMMGADPDDWLLIVLNPSTRECEVIIGDRSWAEQRASDLQSSGDDTGAAS